MDLSNLLSGTLSANANERVVSELELERLQPDPQFPIHLTDLIANNNIPVHLRQISIILRKYVNERWAPFFVAFKGNPPPIEVKSVIKQRVFTLLGTDQKQIRTAAAYALASIASCEYPEQYPSLLVDLASLIRSGSRHAVHGAMRVLVDFVKADLTEHQLIPVAQELLPLLLQIFKSPQLYTDSTRALTVSVLRQCIITLDMVRESYPEASRETAQAIIPVWLDAFIELLSTPSQNETKSQWGIRFEIVKTITSIFSSFKSSVIERLPDLIKISIAHLNDLLPIFIDNQVYDTQLFSQIEGEEDDDGATVEELVCPIVDLISGFTNVKQGKIVFEDQNLNIIPVAVRLALEWGQMTVEEEETWAADPNAFVDDEEDETENYSLRIATHDLLDGLLSRYPIITSKTLGPETAKMLSTSQNTHNEGKSYWWKPIEAALATIGNVSDYLTDEDNETSENFDLVGLCQSVVTQFVTAKDAPFLQGRAFVFASKFSTALPTDLVDAFVEAAAQILNQQDASVPVKVSAVRAIRNFARDLDSDRIAPKAMQILSSIVPLLSITSDSTLGLMVEAVDGLLSTIEPSTLTTDLTVQLVSVILPVWEKNVIDPLLLSQLDDLFVTLSKISSQVHSALVQVSVRPLISAVTSAVPENSDDTDSRILASSALQLINSIVGARENGLEPGVIESTGTVLFAILERSEDKAVVQDAIELLTVYIRKDSQALLSWQDQASEVPTLMRILNVIAKQLSASQSEGSSLFIGDLITHLFRNVGFDILDPALPQLLKAILDRLALSKTSSFTQNLIIPFAYLIRHRREVILDFLNSTAVVDVQQQKPVSGLELLLRMWAENAETFRGFWAIRISTLALIELYTCQDPRLDNIIVKGDQIIDESNRNVIMTRSKTRDQPITFTSIPFPAKILKLIINEVQSIGNSKFTSGLKEVEEDDEDEDWEDDDPLADADDDLGFLSDLLGPGGGLMDNDDDTDDADLRNDPDAQLDINAYLATFLRTAYTENTFNTHDRCSHLTPQEQAIFQQAMVM